MPTALTWKLLQTTDHAPALELVPLRPSPRTLNAASKVLPNGVYTTFRTYQHDRILPLTDHIRRLEESARLLGKPISLDAGAIRAALRKVVIQYGEKDSRIRLTVDLEESVGTIFISAEPLVVPTPEAYQQGVLTITYPWERENPRAKRTNFIQVADKIRSRLASRPDEVLMVDESGQILEGLTSNFFAVMDGVLYTAGEGVLSGITRAMALEVAQDDEIPVQLRSPHLDELAEITEAFLTSSSRSVLPVRQVDDRVLHQTPGPVTRIVSKRFEALLRQRLEDI